MYIQQKLTYLIDVSEKGYKTRQDISVPVERKTMNAAYLEEILSLSKHDRLMIVQHILDSIRMEEEPSSELSNEWKAELDRRSQLLAEGKTKLFSWEEVKAAVTKGK